MEPFNKGQEPERVVIPEMEWLGENEDWLERDHPGKWIAIKGHALIAIGDSLDEVMRIADSKGVDQPFVTGLKSKEYQGVYIIRSSRFIQ
jgi:hypothetical protein